VPRRLLITKRDAAEQLGVSLRTIERLISAGRLPLVHVEGAARVRVGDLEAYVEGLEANGGLETDHQLRTVTTTHP
jgi:excisionase family DNA binding protein